MRASPRLVVVAASLLLATCVSTHMRQFIGRDIRYVAVDSGRPVNVFDMPDGRRAFQYYWGGGTVPVPAVTTTDGEIQLVGDEVWYTETAVQVAGGVIESEGCLITYFASWVDESQGWIVDEVSYPGTWFC